MNCAICKVHLTDANVARREDGFIRLDATGKPWCKECTEEHDSIDFDKEAEA